MKTVYSIAAGLFLFCATQLNAQGGSTKVVGVNPVAPSQNTTQIAGPADPDNPQDGSTFLGPAYQNTACGLNYTTATNKLGQRLSTSCCPPTNGVPQPATFTITGIPASAVVVKAFVWADFSGNGIPVNLNVTNPIGTPFVVPMPVIGGDIDKCWGYAGVYSYRADITATISGNGNYQLSGMPVDPGAATHLNDVDGATMMVIWQDPTAGFEGSLVIWDGAVVRIGGPVTQTMSGFTACTGNISNARAMSIYGDLQQFNSGIILNGMPPIAVAEDWWNYVDVPTMVIPGQTTAVFGNNQNQGDCYNFEMMGLYWQSNCNQACDVPCVAKAVIGAQGCNPVQFTGSNNGVTPVTSWYWDFGDGQTSTLQNPTHVYALPGTYKVCLTITAVSPSGQSCCDQTCIKVEACNPQPCSVDPYFKWEDLPNWGEQFYDYSTGTGVACDWFWDFGDGFTSTLQYPTHYYANPGVYYVCLKVTFCVYDAAGNLIAKCSEKYCTNVPVGVVIITPNRQGNPDHPKDMVNPKKAMLYPNPASNELFINAQEDLKPTVKIINAAGQQVMNAELSAKNLYKVNVQTLPVGMYSVEIMYSDGTSEHLPFVKN
jgi:hypothetical protein